MDVLKALIKRKRRSQIEYKGSKNASSVGVSSNNNVFDELQLDNNQGVSGNLVSIGDPAKLQHQVYGQREVIYGKTLSVCVCCKNRKTLPPEEGHNICSASNLLRVCYSLGNQAQIPKVLTLIRLRDSLF
jgi:hypothetical protein